MVWPYRALAESPETFVFSLVNDAREKSGPMPLVSLVAASISTAEPGLICVVPSTGKITYWESITSAAALDQSRQQRRGLESSVGNMLSGEMVAQLVNAEPAGFILHFTSGRIASLSVRDNQGRPNLRIHMLRSNIAPAGGLFGSLKNVLTGGGWRKDVIAIRAGDNRGREHREMIVATTKGTIQLWMIHRGGQHTLHHEWDAREDILLAIKTAEPDLEAQLEENFELLDFTSLRRGDRGDERTADGPGGRRNILFLGVTSRQGTTTYLLVEVAILQASLVVGLVYKVRSYATAYVRKSAWKPRLLFPKPYQTAFVVFERAIVVASVTTGADSPDQQLLREVHRFPKAFEDVVEFKKAVEVKVVGCESEDGYEDGEVTSRNGTHRGRLQNPACILLLKGVGVIRLTAHLSKVEEPFDEATNLPAKSKIEQAICYGKQPHNPLDFTIRPEIRYPPREIEEAALQISSEILDSSSKAILALTPSLEHQLAQRSTALSDLTSYIRATFPPLSRSTKWQLLWGAEKMAGAREIWRRHDDSLKYADTDTHVSVLAELVDMLHERYKHEPNTKRGELDKVRYWFTKDIGRLEIIVPWAYNTVRELNRFGPKDPAELVELVSEANDISIGALETAFNFRQRNARRYGLEDEPLRNGVLKDEEAFRGLPPFWTSMRLTTLTTRMLSDLSRDFAVEYLEKPPGKGQPDPKRIAKIASDNPAQIDVSCRTYTERYLWCSVQPQEDLKAEGVRLKKELFAMRKVQFRRLASLNLVDAGIHLSEQYQDMGTLVELVSEEISKAALRSNQPGTPEDEKDQQKKRLQMLEDRFERYFRIFGEPWATALFTQHIRKGNLAGLMDDNEEWQAFLTKFLRANPAYAKLSWINDVLAESDIDQARDTLLDVASVKEQDLWSKKVELSIGKLALLATRKDQRVSSTDDERVDRVHRELGLIDIQDKLYQHVAPTVHVAIDEKAEIQLVRSEFGSQVTKDKPALSSVLEQGLATLVAREVIGADRLVDVLTLMDHHYDLENPSELTGQEFYLALQVVQFVRAEDMRRAELLERIIWRRCMIRDDWTVINDTQLKDDRAVEQSTGDTALFTNLQAGYKSGRLMCTYIWER